MGDSGRPTYEGLKQKVQEKDAQLEEALAIIKELTEALQGVRTLKQVANQRHLLTRHVCRKRRRLLRPSLGPTWCARRAVMVLGPPWRSLRRRLATAARQSLRRCVAHALRVRRLALTRMRHA